MVEILAAETPANTTKPAGEGAGATLPWADPRRVSLRLRRARDALRAINPALALTLYC
jgi:hypothetical protein